MNRHIIAFLALFMITATAVAAHAEKRSMLFWYPGEAGSTAEAQPILDELFAYLKEKNGTLAFNGAYFNTVDEGAAYLRTKKPAVGIVSNAVWETQRSALAGSTVLLATRPQPHGKTTERYVLIGVKPLAPAGGTIFTSEPLDAAFVRGKLFADIPATSTFTQTASLFMHLKRIAAGEIEGHAILTPMEAHTLKNLSSPWKEKLLTLATSAPVPTARVILIGGGLTDATPLKEQLLRMNNDADAKPILDELRLVGFAEPAQ